MTITSKLSLNLLSFSELFVLLLKKEKETLFPLG